MKALVIDGFAQPAAPSTAVLTVLGDKLGVGGWDTETVTLRDLTIGYCRGCFGCWHTTPGECVIDDDARGIARSMVQADLHVYLTPITFGGVSSTLKKALDRIICVASPFFEVRNGEVHHKHRYKKRGSTIVIGFQDAPDADAEDVFRLLIARNAANLEPASLSVMVLSGAPDSAAIGETIGEALSGVEVKR